MPTGGLACPYRVGCGAEWGGAVPRPPPAAGAGLEGPTGRTARRSKPCGLCRRVAFLGVWAVEETGWGAVSTASRRSMPAGSRRSELSRRGTAYRPAALNMNVRGDSDSGCGPPASVVFDATGRPPGGTAVRRSACPKTSPETREYRRSRLRAPRGYLTLTHLKDLEQDRVLRSLRRASLWVVHRLCPFRR